MAIIDYKIVSGFSLVSTTDKTFTIEKGIIILDDVEIIIQEGRFFKQEGMFYVVINEEMNISILNSADDSLLLITTAIINDDGTFIDNPPIGYSEVAGGYNAIQKLITLNNQEMMDIITEKNNIVVSEFSDLLEIDKDITHVNMVTCTGNTLTVSKTITKVISIEIINVGPVDIRYITINDKTITISSSEANGLLSKVVYTSKEI